MLCNIVQDTLHGCCRLEKQQDGTILFFYSGPDGSVKSIKAGLVFFGTGRKPSVDNMGLEVCAPDLQLQ